MKLTSRPHHALFNLRRLERLALPFLFSGLLAPFLGYFVTPLHADDSFDDTNYIKMLDDRDRGVGWNMAFGPTAGYTDVLNGYQNYTNKGNAGVDVYFRPPVPQFPEWKDHLLFRLSADYFPLQVPKTIPYTTEDLYTMSAIVLYRLMSFSGTPEHERVIPFVGLGPAVGWDRVSVHHPAVNSSGTFFHMGYSASGGIMLPALWGFRLIPEVRYQSMCEPDHYWTSHISYMVGLTYWPPANVEEQ